MHRASNAYVQTQVTTTGQGEIVVLLFDGAISFLNQAKEAINEKLYEKKGNLISKALDIIDELESTLNMDKGGDLAKNLHTLYSSCSQKLIFANIRLNTQYIDEVIFILSNLREGFAVIVDDPAAKIAAQQIAIKQQPSQAEQRKVPNFGVQPNFTSNARASSLYAKKTAEINSVPTSSFANVAPSAAINTPTANPAVGSSTISPAMSMPKASISKNEASPVLEKNTMDKENLALQKEVTNKLEDEKSLDNEEESTSFGKKSALNMDLYRKFSSLG